MLSSLLLLMLIAIFAACAETLTQQSTGKYIDDSVIKTKVKSLLAADDLLKSFQIVDKRGCAVYSQKVSGPFRNPHTEKASIVKSLAGPVLNALDGTWKFFRDEECLALYSGSVAHPEG
jgi:hypothetical protein